MRLFVGIVARSLAGGSDEIKKELLFPSLRPYRCVVPTMAAAR
jgi:hypothetical protein